jgi:hypothetical protein
MIFCTTLQRLGVKSFQLQTQNTKKYEGTNRKESNGEIFSLLHERTERKDGHGAFSL